MGFTSGLQIPIPELTDLADGPDAFGDTAQAVENYFFVRTLPAGVTRYPSYSWGSGAAFPTSNLLMIGDTYSHTVLRALMVYRGSATWGQANGPATMTQAQRLAIPLATAPLGFQVIETDGFYRHLTRVSSGWLKTSGVSETIDSNNATGTTTVNNGVGAVGWVGGSAWRLPQDLFGTVQFSGSYMWTAGNLTAGYLGCDVIQGVSYPNNLKGRDEVRVHNHGSGYNIWQNAKFSGTAMITATNTDHQTILYANIDSAGIAISVGDGNWRVNF